MNDFGTALIFFAAFVVIALMRSGSFATIALICAGTGLAGGLAVSFRPYAIRRFASWATSGSRRWMAAISRPEH